MHCSKCVSFWGTSYSRPPIDPHLTFPLLQNPGGATDWTRCNVVYAVLASCGKKVTNVIAHHYTAGDVARQASVYTLQWSQQTVITFQVCLQCIVQ